MLSSVVNGLIKTLKAPEDLSCSAVVSPIPRQFLSDKLYFFEKAITFNGLVKT
jgi:hypothetical protein